MDYIIRKLESKDLQELQSFFQKTLRDSYQHVFSRQSIEWFISSCESDKILVKYFNDCDVLEYNGHIRGFVTYFDDQIRYIMVDMSIQRRGFDRILLKHAETELAKSGCTQIFLETYKENKKSYDFFRQNNWRKVKTERQKECKLSRVYFTKKLIQ